MCIWKLGKGVNLTDTSPTPQKNVDKNVWKSDIEGFVVDADIKFIISCRGLILLTSSLPSPGMQVQQHCSEQSTGFQWRLRFSTKLLVSFQCIYQNSMPPYILTFFIHTVPLGGCALLTPLCWQFLASLLRPLGKDLSVFGPTVWNSLPPSPRKTVSQLLKRNLRLTFSNSSVLKCKC